MSFMEQNITLTEEINSYQLENDMDVFGIFGIDAINKVVLMGAMYFIIGIISLVAWVNLYKKPYIKHI